MKPSRLARQRLCLRIDGLVQGVGFRPFIYRLATACGLSGWVANTLQGVELEIEGSEAALDAFRQRLTGESPAAACIETVTLEPRPLKHDSGFQLLTSHTDGLTSGFILPDLAPCPRCVAELFDPANRRHGYPFISCTDCGPRWSIVQALPFDRERTTLAEFKLCRACETEYREPDNRRFHAQTQCCPACGPRLTLTDAQGRVIASDEQAMEQAAFLLQQGRIVAVKGVGGYQLLVDATRQAAVLRLRERKARPAKPLAILCASVTEAAQWAWLSTAERQALESPAAPIVLLHSRPQTGHRLAPALTLGIPLLGIMLPSSPLHHWLMRACGFPLVITSGNRSGEPLCSDDQEALNRLGDLADALLMHDRAIVRPLDDSVVRIVAGDRLVLRRARGYSPTVSLPCSLPPRIALGGHLKNTIAISRGRLALLSQHLGDLDNTATEVHVEATLRDLTRLFIPESQDNIETVCDLHPDYGSSTWFRATTRRVQHHEAHLRACLAEHPPVFPVLGVAFDGLGLGTDGHLWGGEFFVLQPDRCERIATFRPFLLPGGAQAVREPRRVACSLLYQLGGTALCERDDLAPLIALTPVGVRNLIRMMKSGLNSPRCSSVGRWYDAVASLLDLCQVNRFEGEAALRVECAGRAISDPAAYPFRIVPGGSGQPADLIDWAPLLLALLADLPHQPAGWIAARFQQTLIDIIAGVAAKTGLTTLALSGGVFQNAWLTSRALDCLSRQGYSVLRHRMIPPNDGGLSLGQLLAAGLKQDDQVLLR